jgi:general stress protein 26
VANTLSGDLSELIRLIRTIKTALLTTLDDQGQLHTRPLQTLEAEENGTLWFFTDGTRMSR